MPIPLAYVAGAVFVGAVGITGYNTLKHETAETLETAAEEVIKTIIQVLVSGYSLVLGFPGYIVDSIMFETIGFVDPFRTPGYDESSSTYMSYRSLGGSAPIKQRQESYQRGNHIKLFIHRMGAITAERVGDYIEYDQLGVANEQTWRAIEMKELK